MRRRKGEWDAGGERERERREETETEKKKMKNKRRMSTMMCMHGA